MKPFDGDEKSSSYVTRGLSTSFGNERMLTQIDLQAVLTQAATFYRSGSGSSNIVILPERPRDERARQRIDRRVRTVKAEFKNQHGIDPNRGVPDRLMPAYGEFLYQRRRPAGNCGEMSPLVLHLCLSPTSAVWGKCTGIYYVSLATPGDHEFIALTDETFSGPLPAGRPMVSSGALRGLWFIDCWFDFACAHTDYMRMLITKISVWREESRYAAGYLHRQLLFEFISYPLEFSSNYLTTP